MEYSRILEIINIVYNCCPALHTIFHFDFICDRSYPVCIGRCLDMSAGLSWECFVRCHHLFRSGEFSNARQ